MSFDFFYSGWLKAKTQSNLDAQQFIKETLHHLTIGKPDWDWFVEALKDDQKKWFVAALFRKAPIPKRLLRPMFAAAIAIDNPSANVQFVEPCVRSHGALVVLSFLKDVLETETEDKQSGAVRALYWVKGNPRAECLDGIQRELQELMADVFMATDNVLLQRDIISQLDLCAYRTSTRTRAVLARAKSSTDAYVRQRLKVQLGNARGPFMPNRP